jgi:putative component of membrane protein insertase Oxa1/YidC/SpoIIIJ protein YidD
MIKKALDLLMLPFILIIKTWQKFIAPGLAPRCKYYPSCSQYTYESIKSFHIFDYPPKTLKIGPFLLSNRETESTVR